MMRILIVHPMDLGYSAYKYIDHLARALAAYGDTVAVLAPHSGEKRLANGAIPCFEVIETRFEHGLLARHAKQRIAHFDPDIVHVWNVRTTTSRVALEVMIGTAARLVVNYEDPEHYHFDTLTGPAKCRDILRHVDRAFPSPEDIEAFMSELNWHWILKTLPDPNAGEFLHPLFYAILNHFAAGFTGIWHPWVTLLSSRFRKPTALMPYCVDFTGVAPSTPAAGADIRAKLGIGADSVVFIRTGTLYSIVNDQEIMFEGFADFVKRRPDSVLVLCGRDGSPEHTTDIIRRLAIGDRVVRPGFLEQSSYDALLATADVALCPGYPGEYNRYRLALKLIEYMVAGKAMICYASGIGENLEDGRDALLLNEYTPKRVCEHMLTLADNAELRSILAGNARERARQWFDVRVLAERLHGFYETDIMAPRECTLPTTERKAYDPHALFKAVTERQPALVRDGVKRVALYGAGRHTERLLEMTDLAPISVECIVDDSPSRSEIMGIKVIRPSQIHAYRIDAVIISSDSLENELLERAGLWAPENTRIVPLYR